MATIQEIGKTEFDDGRVGFWAHVTEKKAVRTGSGRVAVKNLNDVIFDNASETKEEAEETLAAIADSGQIHRIPCDPYQVELADGETITLETDDKFFLEGEEVPTEEPQEQEQTPLNSNQPEPELA